MCGGLFMPKPGFRSITVSNNVYDYWNKIYEKNKDKLEIEEGITSFTGYIYSILYKREMKRP